MPTGLFNSPNSETPATPQIGPRRAINQAYQIVFLADDTPIRFPFVIVPLGCSVAVRGDNGSGANANPAFVGDNPQELNQTITPDTEINYPSDNLGQIWAMGKAGDGLIAYVRGNALP